MLELIAKTTMSLGIAAIGIIVLTQLTSVLILIIAAALAVIGLGAAFFFANDIFQYNQTHDNYQDKLDCVKI
jgi:uncharacterized membrane protein YgaE (UPF0421/DUF939 family)